MLHPDARISATTKVQIQSHPGERWTVSCCALNKRDGRSLTIARVLVIGKLRFRTNQGGIEQEKRTQFSAGSGGDACGSRIRQGGQEEHEESENRLCIRFPLHPTLSHLLNLVYLLVDVLFPVPSISPSIEKWPVVSEAEGSAMAMCETRQNEANLLLVLIICIL